MSDQHRDELLEKIGHLSAYIRVQSDCETYKKAPPKSRNALATANFKTLKAMLSRMENIKSQMKDLHNTSDSIRLEIRALRRSNESSASRILASNEAILSAMVRFLPSCDLFPSANPWQNTLVEAISPKKLAPEKELSEISNNSKKSWGSVVLGGSAIQAVRNIKTPNDSESAGSSATSAVHTQSTYVRRGFGSIDS